MFYCDASPKSLYILVYEDIYEKKKHKIRKRQIRIKRRI